MSALKSDDSKPRMDLIPPEALFAMADILSYGAKKYEDNNWAKGMRWGRMFAALNRHLWAWWMNTGPDEETGRSHLHHAICCLAFLIAYESRNIGTDDRIKHESVPLDTSEIPSRKADTPSRFWPFRRKKENVHGPYRP